MVMALAKGLALTFKTLFRPRITLQYPEEKKVMYDRWRGRPYLTKADNGQERCIACHICAQRCPAQAIKITSGKREDNSRFPVRFELDLGRCIFCSFCAQSCPKDAIRMSHAYELAVGEKGALVLSKENLLERPE